MGLSAAIGFSIVAMLVCVVARRDVFTDYHISLGRGLAMYILTGVGVGAVGGALTPLMRSAVGMVLCSVFVLSPMALAGILIGLYGWHYSSHFSWIASALFSVPVLMVAFGMRRRSETSTT